MFKQLVLILLLCACSTAKKSESPSDKVQIQPKEFSKGELILGNEFLTKIFDRQMAPVQCVPDTDEAALLLRTIRPRMDVVTDDMEALLDNPQEVDQLIKTCDQSCTCGYVDELLREHQVSLTKSQQRMLQGKKTDKEIARCLNFVRETFCQSELYKALEQEKADFSFE